MKKALLVAGAVLVVGLLLASLWWVQSGRTSPFAPEESPMGTPPTGIQMDENVQEGGLTLKSKEEIQEELNRKVEEGMINISMNTSPVFEDGKAKGDLMIVNSERNNYPQVVYIVLKDTQEEIYRSGAIPVGSKIEYAPLDVDLDPGVYDCVAYFNNVDVESGAYLGTAGAEIQITVQK